MVTERLDLTADELAKWAAGVEDRVARADFSKPAVNALVATKADVKRNFDEGHSPDGEPWRPLAHKRVRKENGLPLRKDGFLMASISAFGEGHIENLNDTGFTVGTNLEYAAIHQNGGVILPKGHPYLAIPATIEAERFRRPRNFPRKLVYVKRQGHGPILIEEKKGRGKNNTFARSIIQYWLTDHVTIPARPFAGFSQRLTSKIGVIYANYLQHLV